MPAQFSPLGHMLEEILLQKKNYLSKCNLVIYVGRSKNTVDERFVEFHENICFRYIL